MEIDPQWFHTMETDPFHCSGHIQFHIVEGALSSEVTLGYPRHSLDRASAPRARGGAAMGKSEPHPYGLDPPGVRMGFGQKV